MKVMLESTTKVVELITPSGARIEARIWEGHTEAGVPMHAFIVRVATLADGDTREFERDLLERANPSEVVEAIPLRIIL